MTDFFLRAHGIAIGYLPNNVGQLANSCDTQSSIFKQACNKFKNGCKNDTSQQKDTMRSSNLREKFTPIFVHKSLRLEIWCGSPEDPQKQFLLIENSKIRVKNFCPSLPATLFHFFSQASEFWNFLLSKIVSRGPPVTHTKSQV